MANKKHIILILIAIGAILSVCGVVIAATVNIPDPNVYTGTIYVSTTGNDDSNGFTPKTSKKSIKKAVDNAPDGSTVLVAPGTYIEDTIHIDKKIKLIGSGQENTIIRSKGKTIRSVGYDVYVKGFTMRPQKFSIFTPIIAVISGFITVEDCTLLDFCGDENLSFINGLNSGEIVMKRCTFVDHKSIFDYERSLH